MISLGAEILGKVKPPQFIIPSRVVITDPDAQSEHKKERTRKMLAMALEKKQQKVLSAIKAAGEYVHSSKLAEATGISAVSVGHICGGLEKNKGSIKRFDKVYKYVVWGLPDYPLPDVDKLLELRREWLYGNG